ncbi:hypothetical protein SLNSH_17355 [Alsobacter soli]|uniref:Uncharacterized protein n=1 Tax=Alsobacter soli TaxID=2109933 RepID=A0A2T1HPX4_9HYPH|nr:hypothetical protein [Alsobacter soli]PSC03712.1 hypothetical protein SLNSH_17355 [Alsobacter soli]
MKVLFAKGLAAGLAGAAILAAVAGPAEAGRRTGKWKYSPDLIYQMQRDEQRAAWRARHGYYDGYYRAAPPYGRAYGYYGRRPYMDDDY